MPYYKVVEENGTKELKDYSRPQKNKAIDVSYDSSNSPLSATDVQGAIDELTIGNLIKNITYPVGTIIESTTCDTMAKVIATYGGTTWIQHSGYVLRGATSGVVANSATKTGGNDNAVVIKHSHVVTSAHGQVFTDYIGGSSTTVKWAGNVATTGAYSNPLYADYNGEDGTNKNIPNYKSVYIWERTA